MKWVSLIVLWLGLSGTLLAAAAQEPVPPAATPEQGQVKFLFDWNQGRPWLSYSITVHSDGKAHFSGDPNPLEGGASEPVQQDFTVSEANRQKIFELAKRLKYFQGNFDYQKKIAQTGQKTLEYQSATNHGSTTYNWSENHDIQELTKLFQAMATTIDYGEKLAFQYRFDKLGMDQRVRELEQLQAEGSVEELAVLEPILRKIADDPSMMHISRLSAKHLLKTMGGPPPQPVSGSSQP
jgi:hypothetical protein